MALTRGSSVRRMHVAQASRLAVDEAEGKFARGSQQDCCRGSVPRGRNVVRMF